MPTVASNSVELHYERAGTGEPVLMIMGLGGQLTDWPEGFVELMSKRFDVILFDNRDSGLSTSIDHPIPTRTEMIGGLFRPGRLVPAYTLADMANDAAGLLDALEIERAHVVGMSMGGMIGQRLAIDHPERVLSLCSIMSNTGSQRSGRPAPKVLALLARRADPDRSNVVEETLDLFELIGGTDWDRDAQRLRTARSVARCFNPRGVIRQWVAVVTTRDRAPALGSLTAPTLVVHGLDDLLVRPSGGVATARAIGGSRLLMLPGMGHDLPATRHVEIVEAIAINAARVVTARSG